MAEVEVLWAERVIRGEVAPAEAVHACHAALGKKGLRTVRTLEADLAITDSALAPR
jgi:hypothetical protein